MQVSKQEEIDDISFGKRHLVILGAGASVAALPSGDLHGKQLPLMNNFTSIVPMPDQLSGLVENHPNMNFEELYSELSRDESKSDILRQINECVVDYFSSIRLPDFPTIYDYLVLSLRCKDVIATFNWDPLLVQAVQRNSHIIGTPPGLLFMHGNVAVGFCEVDKRIGVFGQRCPSCKQMFNRIDLLYPVTQKNYQADKVIASFWKSIQQVLNETFMITIFGYSAPTTDAEARKLLLTAWGGGDRREMEQIEIIDLKDENEIQVTWNEFIHSHHYDVVALYQDCWIHNHPRRTGEAYWNQYIEAKFIDDNPPPQNCTLPELQEWFKELREAEMR